MENNVNLQSDQSVNKDQRVNGEREIDRPKPEPPYVFYVPRDCMISS